MADLQTLKVELGDRSYPIAIGRDLLRSGFDIRPYLPGGDCLIVSNEIVAPLYLQRVTALAKHCNVHSLQLWMFEHLWQLPIGETPDRVGSPGST